MRTGVHRAERSADGLRILAVGNMYPPYYTGGYELLWQAVMRCARAQGHAVRILVSDYRSGDAVAYEEPDVHRTLRWYWDLHRYEFANQAPRERLMVERHNARELERHLREFQPDVVSWWSMGCLSLAMIEQVKRAGIPGIFMVIDDWLAYGRSHDAWMRAWTGRRRLLSSVVGRLSGIAVRVDEASAGPFVFCSKYTLERARDAGVDVTRAAILFPGINESFLDPAPSHDWGWRLAYIGRIDRQKGVDTAVEALRHLPAEATLSVWGVGDEDYVKEMKAQATAAGVADRVFFRGFVEGPALYAAYAEADAVVFPVRWEEPFGLVPLEAMGVGRPVVATARGGTREFLRHEHNALVFEAGDDQALAACVSRLGQDDSLRRRLVDQGAQTATEYTMSAFAQRAVDHIVGAARAPSASASAVA
jgi:glycogen synthase